MAFFCSNEKCGERTVAPGQSVGCGGPVPAHDGTENASAAEHAADVELAKYRDARGETRISPEIERACLGAAMASLAKVRKGGGGEAQAPIRNESKSAGKPVTP